MVLAGKNVAPQVGDQVVCMHTRESGCAVGELIEIVGDERDSTYVIAGICGETHRWSNTGVSKLGYFSI